MKILILMLISLSGVASTSLRGPCCPCEDESPITKIIEYVVQEPDVSRGNPDDLINTLIKILVDKKVIDKPTGDSILVTFGKLSPSIQNNCNDTWLLVVSPVPKDAQGGKPLTPATVPTLVIGGKPVEPNVVKTLIKLIERPSKPGLIKFLVEGILNHRVLNFPEIIKIFIDFGMCFVFVL